MSLRRIYLLHYCLILLFCCVYQQQGVSQYFKDIDFKYIDLKNNASTPSVNTYCITKDKQGYIWIATSKGVRRYDGRNTSTLNNKALAEDVLTKVVYQDREGSIWIGTQGDGICRYNYLNDRLECFQNDPNNPSSINHNDILSIYQDSQGRLWVGTEGGLNLFDYATKQFKDYSDLVPHPVLHLQEDQQQHLWIGTWGGGLNLLIPSEYTSSGQQEELLTILPTARTPFALPSPHVWDILFDKDGRMWLAMFDGGIGVMQVPNCDNYYACTPSDFQFIQVDAPNGKYNTPTRNVVYSLAQDQAGYIWIGTLWGTSVLDAKQLAQSDDLSYLQESLRKIPVQTFQPDRKNPTAIADYHIRDIYTDEDGAVWFATLTDLSKYTPPKERFSRKQVVEESPIPIPVDAFYKDSTGQLLVAASNKAIYRYDTISQSHKLVVQDDALNMMDIFAPNLDTIWIGTETDLLYYTSTKGLRKYVLRDAKGEVVSLKNVRCIFECSRGGIWLGTDVGLIWFDPRRKNQQVFQYDSTLKGTISHNMVIDIAEGPDAQLYIATQGGGVNILSLENISPTGFQQLSDIVQGDLSALKSPILSNVAFLGQQLWVGSERGIFQYDLQTKQLYHHDKLNKNISGQVSSIECDEDLGLVWVSSLKKLLCYAPTQQQLKTFLPEDGIPNGMNLRASYQDADGNLYFGGMDSYISFYSADIPSNTFEPSDKVSITALKIAGEEVKIGTIDPYTNQAILQQSISNTEQILLSTAHRGIKIEFTMLDYSSSRYNYMYRLQGFEKDWHYTDEQNNESYQQLPAGDYVFEVKASNSDGFESQPTRLAVCVRAPFIQTTTFKFIVTIWVLLLLYALYSYKTYIIQREKRQLELLVQERTEALQHQNQQKEAALAVAQEQRSKAERANAAKTVFLTTMSHEVRTPMHGILGIAQLLEKTTMDIIQKEYLRAMQRNSKQLLYIVNDILDYTKLESGMMELDIRSFHLQKCIEEVIQILQPRAQEKELQLLYELSETAPKYIQTDSTRLQQILINLVGNSIKFTDQGSITVKIAVDIQPSKPWLKIVVEDTGIGIKEEKLNILFEAFSQADDSMTRRHGGMGLGLTICAGLLRLLGGTLDINTVVHKGTRIDLSIPVQIEDQQLAALKDQEQHHIPDHETASYYPANILIAEDNKFNRMLLDKVLSRLGYNATFVNTGLEAVKAAEGADFDLIFMDLNMPEMSGIEATEIILNRHKHQPTVVALTANAQKEIKEACLAAGMKKFVSKPFKVDYIRKIIIEYINYEPPI